jgi:hypothetical protein
MDERSHAYKALSPDEIEWGFSVLGYDPEEIWSLGLSKTETPESKRGGILLGAVSEIAAILVRAAILRLFENAIAVGAPRPRTIWDAFDEARRYGCETVAAADENFNLVKTWAVPTG